MSKTIEEIAWKTVEQLIRVIPYHNDENTMFIELGEEGTDGLMSMLMKPRVALVELKTARAFLRKRITRAIEEAFQQVEVPGPVGEEELVEIRGIAKSYKAWCDLHEDDADEDKRCSQALDDAIAHIDHLTRCLHDCGQDGSAAIWSAGYRAAQEKYEAELKAYKELWNCPALRGKS